MKFLKIGQKKKRDEKEKSVFQVKKSPYIAAIMGFVIGDALGVPVEFKSREELRKKTVRDMTGQGTYNQPKGTWSDDSSMVVATMEWLGEIKKSGERPYGYNYGLLMDKFLAWLRDGAYTPYGNTFDCGIAVRKALLNYESGIEPLKCGGLAERDNGNGSLMRILPAALWFGTELASGNPDSITEIFHLSKLTHAHMRSQIGCFLYAKIIADIMDKPDADKFDIIEKSLAFSKEYLDRQEDAQIKMEMENYNRLWDLKQFSCLPEAEIKSTGYVVYTLEAAIWCFLNTSGYQECVLKAVNLGDDTDTVGAIAGGLAGLYYGMKDIPNKWVNSIPKKEWIEELAAGMGDM